MGHTKTNRQGFDKSVVWLWSKASHRERREIVVQEIREKEDGNRVQITALQSQQWQCMAWEGVLQRSLTWNDICKMVPTRLSFVIARCMISYHLETIWWSGGSSKTLYAPYVRDYKHESMCCPFAERPWGRTGTCCVITRCSRNWSLLQTSRVCKRTRPPKPRLIQNCSSKQDRQREGKKFCSLALSKSFAQRHCLKVLSRGFVYTVVSILMLTDDCCR